MRSKQLHFSQFSRRTEFGGSLFKGHPRGKRPLSTKHSMHVVMRSSLARGHATLLKPKRAKRIKQCIEHQAKKRGIRIYQYANSGNHLHLLIKPPSRRDYAAFIRAVTGLIVRITFLAEKGWAMPFDRFWDTRPFTRIVQWGQAFARVARYVVQNALEAQGLVPYRKRNFMMRV